MVINNLKHLFKSMKNNNLKRCQFHFSMGKAVFDVFFFIDETPYTLMLGAKGQNFYFEVPVKQGFIIESTLDNNVYTDLCKILGLKFDPDRPFSPKIFFGELDKNIPHSVGNQNVPKPHHVAIYRKNVEENDKIYFTGWLDNTKQSKKVSPENLKKTKLLLGNEAFLKCQQKNISSCWSADANRAKDYFMP